jgi:AcrR family transcriptional regulator
MSANEVTRLGRPRSEQAAEAIIEATLDELAEHGYRGLSIEGVATRAGVAKTTVYRRWPGKDELVLEALQRIKGPVLQAPGNGVRDDLVYLLDWIRKSWMDSRYGMVMRRLAAEASQHPELYQAYRERLIQPRQAVMRNVLRRGVEEGLIRDDVDLTQVLDLLVAPAIAAGMTLRTKLTKRNAEFVVDTVLAGLRP